MTSFQSYLILGQTPELQKEQTEKLAGLFAINLEKISPDVTIIKPQATSIGINEVRELKRHIYEKPVKEKVNLVIFEDADKLTHEAQNALLKILEEPPPSAVIVLVTNDKSQLLPTILSRVTVIRAKPQKPILDREFTILGQKNVQKLLLKIADVQDPIKFLDDQIMILDDLLKENLKRGGKTKLIVDSIEKCVETKKMIRANVNPRFALYQLALSLF